MLSGARSGRPCSTRQAAVATHQITREPKVPTDGSWVPEVQAPWAAAAARTHHRCWCESESRIQMEMPVDLSI